MGVWPDGTIANTRVYVGTTPPAAQSGMMWHSIGEQRHIEIPIGFVEEVISRGVPAEMTPAQPSLWSEAAKQANSIARDVNGASGGKVSKWVWPGIPIAITVVKFGGWLLGKGRK